DWYVGGVTNEKSRRIHISLDFLSDGVYRAEIYSDRDDAHYRENPFSTNIQQKHVGRNGSLDLYIAPGGGFAIRLQKLQ
ncbi:MAG: glycoside hydrolase family 97 C-terminal domain-containing protein, partial [Candidatus Saccharibacteria bacterium]|nr:glycoside hydrolase family 97 C-terminal domain-containing protein [Candidatus Saccharibacteria bacterium]